MDQVIQDVDTVGGQDMSFDKGPVKQFILLHAAESLTSESVDKPNSESIEALTVQFDLASDSANVNEEDFKTQNLVQIQEGCIENENGQVAIAIDHAMENDGGGNDNQMDLIINHPHPSVVTGLGDIQLRLCEDAGCICGGSGTSVHCPMCPGSETLGDQSSAEEHILQEHWSKRTEVCKDICLLTCYCVDKSAPHIHCPICGAILPRDQNEDHHLIVCINNQKQPINEDVTQNETPKESSEALSSNQQPVKEKQGSSLKDHYHKFYHPSMVSSLEDVQLKPCFACCRGRKFHCPICPVSLYRPNKQAVVKTHIETHHWRHSVKFQDIFIMKCTAPCKGKVNGMPLDYHWHCPLCSVKVSTKQAMNGHLCAHTRGTQLRHRTNAEWASLLGPEAASVLFKSKSFQPMLGTDTDWSGVELETGCGPDLGEDDPFSSAASNSNAPKKKEVFQTVVGILTKDMIQAIPGCVSVYFSELQKEENIQYINSDDWCLLQGDWKSLSNIHKRLKVFLKNGSSASGVVGPGGDANAESDFYEEISTKDGEMKESGSRHRKKRKGSPEFGSNPPGSNSDLAGGEVEEETTGDRENSLTPTAAMTEAAGGEEPSHMMHTTPDGEEDGDETMNDQNIGPEGDLKITYTLGKQTMESQTNLQKMGLRSGKAIEMRKHVVKDLTTSVEKPSLSNTGSLAADHNDETEEINNANVLFGLERSADVKLQICPKPAKRAKGRPRKIKDEKAEADGGVADNAGLRIEAVKDLEESSLLGLSSSEEATASSPKKRGRGRPRKSASSTSIKTESILPLVSGKRKRKPTRKVYENGDFDKKTVEDEDENDEGGGGEDSTESLLKANRPNIESGKTADSIDSNEGDVGYSLDECEKIAKSKAEAPDITISISEDTGALLSVSIGNTETENIKREVDEFSDGVGVSTSQATENALFKGLSLARKVKISVCPGCSKVCRDKHRFHQHLFGSNCLKKRKSKDKNFKLPPDIAALVKEVNEEVTQPVCPRCDKQFAQVFHAQMHYAARACILTAEEKYNGLVLNPETQNYHCRSCEFASPIVHRVIIHEQRKHMEKTEACPLCNKLYSSQALVREHIKAVHAMGNGRTVCELCGVSVGTKSLQQHMKIKHDPSYVRPKPKSKKLYTCPHCKDFRATSYSRFFRHRIKAHKDADKQCPHCDQKFAMMGELNRHIKFVHEGLQQETAACPQCGKSVTKKNMAAHVRMVHDKIRKHSCELCGRTFLTKFTLKQHIETHKPSGQRDTKFLCAFCGKGFMNKTHYTDHLNTHTGARPHVCTVCNKTFRCSPALAKHKELHKNINLHCATCDLHFPSRKALRIHNNKEHSTSLYKCVCSAVYNSHDTLVAHRRRCGQWQQAHPMENHALQQEQQMAMIIQPEEGDVAHAAPGTYIVMEGKEGEQTIMVLQSLNDLQDRDVVEAIAGSEVMATMAYAGETQVAEGSVINGEGNTEVEQKVMGIAESGLVAIPSSDIMTITGQAEALEQLHVANESGSNDNTALLDVSTLSQVQDGVDGTTAGVSHAEDLNRYLCGYCQRLFTSLDDVQAHMLAEHMASETGEVELALHQEANEDGGIYADSEQSLL